MRLWSVVRNHERRLIVGGEIIGRVIVSVIVRRLSASAKRLDVGDQPDEIVLGHLAGERGHDRLVAGGDLRARQQDRIADDTCSSAITIVAALQRHRPAIETLERRRANRAASAVTAGAAELPEQVARLRSPACRSRPAAPARSRNPACVQHDDTTGHARMIGAAVFGAEQMIDAGCARPERQVLVAARHHVVLDAEGRHEEASGSRPATP